MQQILEVRCSVEEYCKKEVYRIQKPKKCPMCGTYKELKCQGYYHRNFLSKVFAGKIPIRRYYCKKCKKTLSILPSFCQPFFQYSPSNLLEILLLFLSRQRSISEFCRNIRNEYPNLRLFRQHIKFYLKRIIKKLKAFEIALRVRNMRVRLPKEEAAPNERVKSILKNIQSYCSFKIFLQEQSKPILSLST